MNPEFKQWLSQQRYCWYRIPNKIGVEDYNWVFGWILHSVVNEEKNMIDKPTAWVWEVVLEVEIGLDNKTKYAPKI